ncbi:flagellar biosynthesis protein [Tabrizicola sp. J26]|uniref:FliH/SctL family protein n=1 Tax=Alitabrizicola rongguiensis TaxID=2909234 RepID=UPI001F26C77D|nr:flagellar biosynthesis protein [Tabrizicola rongguiensis]MCF1710639.1 flagellar biosynthesis protein [Tabrizicola rongguiensis]
MPPLKLEVFDSDERPSVEGAAPADADLEELRLAAYESGYAAGWEDAAATEAQEQTKLRVDIARNLQSLSFTYHEARSHIIRALGPLLQEMACHVVPQLARDALAPTVLEALMPLAERASEVPVTLVLNPTARPAVEPLLEASTGLPVRIREEPSLGEGQVFLIFEKSEVQIDLQHAAEEITTCLQRFYQVVEGERKHG